MRDFYQLRYLNNLVKLPVMSDVKSTVCYSETVNNNRKCIFIHSAVRVHLVKTIFSQFFLCCKLLVFQCYENLHGVHEIKDPNLYELPRPRARLNAIRHIPLQIFGIATSFLRTILANFLWNSRSMAVIPTRLSHLNPASYS